MVIGMSMLEPTVHGSGKQMVVLRLQTQMEQLLLQFKQTPQQDLVLLLILEQGVRLQLDMV